MGTPLVVGGGGEWQRTLKGQAETLKSAVKVKVVLVVLAREVCAGEGEVAIPPYKNLYRAYLPRYDLASFLQAGA